MTLRGGFALVVSLLLVMALAVLSVGMVVLGTREATIAAATERGAAARRQAEAAVREAVAHWSTTDRLELAIGAAASPETSGPESQGIVLVERVDSALFYVHAHAATETASAAAGLLVHALLPSRLALAFPAAATAGDALVAGALSGVDACGAGDAPALLSASATIAPEAQVDGAVLAGAPPEISPDPFAPPLAGLIATATVAGSTVSPVPRVEGGQCAPDGAHWGALDAWHACFGVIPMVHAAAGLVVDGGEGGVILVVEGDLVLTGGAQLAGIVVATGRLVIEDGASVAGVVRAAAVDIRDGSLTFDSCTLADALASPALRQAFRPGPRWWVPTF